MTAVDVRPLADHSSVLALGEAPAGRVPGVLCLPYDSANVDRETPEKMACVSPIGLSYFITIPSVNIAFEYASIGALGVRSRVDRGIGYMITHHENLLRRLAD